ncbi:hypothetical protein BT63DRAFT_429139 [Microthyrium microscopicum]|uniref:F-box domain-containing protein n=1 Tax=Microthyrium microscopicum TaxID=703497 RepID=A0A6A6TYQ9_9PEZI|nr:hypothetical protein BT63DRAFT_429139 [Microthyrium microscopicum]
MARGLERPSPLNFPPKPKRQVPFQARDLESTNWIRLPPELWLEITDHLPPSSAAALALTSQHMYQCLERLGTFAKLKGDLKERVALLELLDDQCPDHFLCSYCGVFHLRKWGFEQIVASNALCAYFPKSCRMWRMSLLASREYYLNIEGIQFHWFQLYLAMRRHRLGSAYGSPLSIINDPKNNKYPGTTKLLDAAISDDRLLLRSRSYCQYISSDSDSDRPLHLYRPSREQETPPLNVEKVMHPIGDIKRKQCFDLDSAFWAARTAFEEHSSSECADQPFDMCICRMIQMAPKLSLCSNTILRGP